MPATAGERTPDSNWYAGADIPGGLIRYGATQCPEQPGSFYVFAGIDASYRIATGSWRYDSADNIWQPLSAIPNGGEGVATACYQGRIYVMGGSGSNQFYIYDITSDSWLAGPPLPRNVWGAAAAAWEGKVYLVGGDEDFTPGGTSPAVDIYDIAANSWDNSGAAMPAAAVAAGFVQQGPYLYLAGGWGDMAPTQNITATQRYDLANDLWSLGVPFEGARADFALGATAEALYALGGDGDGGSFFDASSQADRLALDSWGAGGWTMLDDKMPAATTSNSASFCSSGFFAAQVWSLGGFSNYAITGLNRFLGRNDESCFSIYSDVSWLQPAASSGAVATDSSAQLVVTIDATGLTAGEHQATLMLVSNDAGIPVRAIPVSFTVRQRYWSYLPLIRKQ